MRRPSPHERQVGPHHAPRELRLHWWVRSLIPVTCYMQCVILVTLHAVRNTSHVLHAVSNTSHVLHAVCNASHVFHAVCNVSHVLHAVCNAPC